MDVDDAGWRRIALYLLITLASVFAPGAVIVASLAIWRVSEDSLLLQSLQSGTADDAGALRFLWIVAGLSLSYLVGYFARAVGFFIVQTIGKRWGPKDTVKQLRDNVVDRFGQDAWNQAMSTHPSLRASLAGSLDESRLRDDPLFDAFIYCKLWLRRMAPTLNIDAIELEINVLCGSLGPVAAVTLLTGHQAQLPAVGWGALVVLALASGWVIVANALKLMRDERYEAFRNVVADTSMRAASTSAGAPVGVSAPTGGPVA